MNQSRAFFISLAFAFVGMGLVAFYINEQERKLTLAHGDLVQVVVAKSVINEMQVVDISNLDVQAVPRTYVQPSSVKIDPVRAAKKEAGFVTDISELRGMVALVPIQSGEQILITKLAPKGAETGLASQVAANKRAMSIAVDDVSGVTRLIKPGDRVDILSSISYPKDDGEKETELKTLLQNVHILAVGEIVQNNIPQVFETDPLTQRKIATSGRADTGYATVTVEVTPDQAQILLYTIAQESRLFLTLRNPVDRVESAVGTTTIDEVLGPDSKRAERRDAEQRRIVEEARRQAELLRLQQLQQQERAPAAPGPVYDPLEMGGGVLE